jgi:uncharacterized protein YceK
MLYFTPIGLSLSLLLSGCATVVNGTHQSIGVSSNPAGASVMVDNQKNFVTPASVELKRNQSHTFVFSKPGYKDDSFVITSGTSGWVWGNILIGGLIGTAVDFASGGARKLSQESVHVSLVPLAAHDIPTAAALPAVIPAVAVAEPIPAVLRQANEPAMYNNAPAADTQLRNAEHEFRAGRMSLEEFRSIKKVLTGE